ncbi:ABC-three component system middle component 6 [Acetivibrio clariflavus]|uniref:Uncharacterized protein n=1 Tax=Acetivibrio clariflavus (strain DSM 19732 / NBRC 101661 / EBR45) TaxID=720554 RepID=G8LSE2_ACECE|nr:ABC-three component system middle component 6 [Acetivibrio clariflavus]AEV67203.1 hypothetical protein Clocl_0479 [Acetivibrio clariflavus DSM 19732]
MILPNKYITLSESYFGLSALILEVLKDKSVTVDKLWNSFVKKYILTGKLKNPPTYQKFIYVLEYMYMCDMISYNEGGEIFNENIKFKDKRQR